MIPTIELDQYDSVYITTTAREAFEITPNTEGYLLNDITPPPLEMDISVYHSVKSATYQPIDNGTRKGNEIAFFDGIKKGFHFAWKKKSETDLVITKGKIDSCIVKLRIQNLLLIIQLLEVAGRKFDWASEKKSFTVLASGIEYVFNADDEGFTFEGRRVIGIFSLYKAKRIAVTELFQMQNEYDVSKEFLYYNHPFIILTERADQKTSISFCNETIDHISI
jgi:hypothetical protein